MISTILFNDFKAQWDDISHSALSAFDRVGKSGWLILGNEVKQFESNLAKEWGLPFAVTCANGLDALEISLRCLEIKPGDKVLTTPLSAYATTLAITRAGGIPAFADVDHSGLIDLDLCIEILEKDPQIKYFVPVHLYGHALNLKKLNEIKERFGVKIVEDCAQAINAKSFGESVGTVGQMAATSFYPTKNLGCMGDGGALLTQDTGLANLAKSLRDYGQTEKYIHFHAGLNSRLDEVQAAILNDALLPKLATNTAQRIKIAQLFLKEIKNPNISFPSVPEGSESVWHLFPVLIAGNRADFESHLKDLGISCGQHYPKLIPDQEALNAFDKTSLLKTDLKKARMFAEQEVSLPIHPYLSYQEIERIISACNSWNN